MGEKLCEQMQVVVLMGGLGTRLKERTGVCPKPLIDVNGRPFFEYELRLLIAAGFRQFLFCVGYRAEMIEQHFGSGERYGVEIAYSYDGPALLGTGGAVRKALPLLDDDFLLIYGDSFMDIDYFEVVVRYRNGLAAGKKALMTVMRNRDRFDKSNVICRGGDILLYDKRAHSSEMEYVDYGISVFQKELFRCCPENERFDLSDIQHALSVKGQLGCCEVEHRFYEIGNPSSLAEFTSYAEQRWDTPHKAVFLDRDGVINEIVWNEDAEQLDSPLKRDQFKLIAGAADGLKLLQDMGFMLFVVTNQPAAAKGKTSYAELCAINHEFVQDMQRRGIGITEVAMCPHFSTAGSMTKETFLIKDCSCRKPKTGLIDRIKEKYNIDLDHSWMVGDSATDILCGKKAGLQTAFIGKFKCDLCMMIGNDKPDLVCTDLYAFAREVPGHG